MEITGLEHEEAINSLWLFQQKSVLKSFVVKGRRVTEILKRNDRKVSWKGRKVERKSCKGN